MTPSVSVIIPTYNRANLLERAIRSVLAQTYRDFEIIVVDDASTDNTQEMLKEKLKQEIDTDILRYIKNEINMERSRSRNKGMEVAKGKYIALLDDDDIWLPEHLEFSIDFLQTNEDVGCIFTNFFLIPLKFPSNARLMFTNIQTTKDNLYRKFCITGKIGSPSTAVLRKSIYERLGGFNTEISVFEDREFFSRVAMNYTIGFLAMPTVCRFQHSGTYSRPSAEAKENIFHYIEENSRIYHYDIENELKANLLMDVCHTFIHFRNIKKAKDYFLKAFKTNPRVIFTKQNLLLLLRFAMGQRLYETIKRSRSNG